MATKKNINDSIFAIATRFKKTDESRFDENWLNYKIDSVCAQLKIDQYLKTNILDTTWLGEGGMVTFHKVNRADDPSITYCNCDLGKAFLPPVISFVSKDGNLDLGFYSIVSACGTTAYYPKRMFQWSYAPSEHTNSLFGYYTRVNGAMYTSVFKEKLRVLAFWENPEDGKLIASTPIASGSIVSGTVYLVKYASIIYNGTVVLKNTTFTGGATTTFTGSGTVYLNSQARAYRDTDPYPASIDMIRQIELEILTKEFGIEMKMLVDVRNDSKDDAVKSPT